MFWPDLTLRTTDACSPGRLKTLVRWLVLTFSAPATPTEAAIANATRSALTGIRHDCTSLVPDPGRRQSPGIRRLCAEGMARGVAVPPGMGGLGRQGP